jgi:hypothetical protein
VEAWTKKPRKSIRTVTQGAEGILDLRDRKKQEAGEHDVMRSVIICASQLLRIRMTKENHLGGTCSAYGNDGKCIKNWKTVREDDILETST